MSSPPFRYPNTDGYGACPEHRRRDESRGEIGSGVSAVACSAEELDIDEGSEHRIARDRVETPESLSLLLRQLQLRNLEILSANEVEPIRKRRLSGYERGCRVFL